MKTNTNNNRISASFDNSFVDSSYASTSDYKKSAFDFFNYLLFDRFL